MIPVQTTVYSQHRKYKAIVKPTDVAGVCATVDIYVIQKQRAHLVFFVEETPFYNRNFAISDDGKNFASVCVGTLNNLNVRIFKRSDTRFVEQEVILPFNSVDVAYFGEEIYFSGDFYLHIKAKVLYREDGKQKEGIVDFVYQKVIDKWLFMGESEIKNKPL